MGARSRSEAPRGTKDRYDVCCSFPILYVRPLLVLNLFISPLYHEKWYFGMVHFSFRGLVSKLYKTVGVYGSISIHGASDSLALNAGCIYLLICLL